MSGYAMLRQFRQVWPGYVRLGQVIPG